jgi:hypothetical protein
MLFRSYQEGVDFLTNEGFKIKGVWVLGTSEFPVGELYKDGMYEFTIITGSQSALDEQDSLRRKLNRYMLGENFQGDHGCTDSESVA